MGLQFLPDDEWRLLRMLVFSGGLVLLLLALSGVLEVSVFAKPTTIKYAVTIVGGAFLVVLATIRAPLRLLVGLVIILAPFDFVVTTNGAQITPLIAVVILAVVVALPRRQGGTGTLRWAPPVFAVLLLPAIAGADGPGRWLVWLGVTVAAGWVTYLVACEPGGPRFVGAMLALSALIQASLALWEFKTGHQLNLYSSTG